MIILGLAALALQATAVDSLLVLARDAPQSALVAEARARPLEVRDAVVEAMRASARTGGSGGGTGALDAAARLAEAISLAWGDPFPVRRVERFRGWSPDRRAASLAADSLRRAGNAVFGVEGPEAAIAIWRQSVEQALAIGDSAAVAAALGNIGAAFLRLGEPDSAGAHLRRARSVARRIGDLRVEGNAVGALATVSLDRGELAEAQQGFEAALALRRRIGDGRGAAADHNQLGLLARELGDHAAARRQFEAALELSRRGGWTDAAATNLTNLAGLAALEGEFARASGLYRDALGIWRDLGRSVDAADVLHGQGQLETRRGDYPAALSVLEDALAIYDDAGLLLDALSVRADLADLLVAVGDPQRALDELREAERQASRAEIPPETRARLALARADLSSALNQHAAAERAYAAAGRLFAEAGDPWGQAAARQGAGVLLLGLDAYERAEQLLADAARAQDAAGDPRSAALTRMLLARAHAGQGDTTAATALLERTVATLEELGDPVAQAAALVDLAELEVGHGAALAAGAHYEAALGLLEGRVAPDVAWRARYGRALLLRAGRGVDRSAAELRHAVAEIERAGSGIRLPERRSAFHRDHWEVYGQLALTERIRGDIGAAFEASERLRAREMLELLSRGRVVPGGGGAAEPRAREQDLRRRIAELTASLDPSAPFPTLRGPAPAPAGPATQEALARAQELYAEVLLELRDRAPRDAELITPSTPSWREIAARLPAGSLMIEYLVTDSGGLAFVITPDTLAAVDLGIGRRELAPLVQFARASLVPATGRSARPGWHAPLRRLHEHLVRPIEETGLLTGATRLVLVPHAELHYLPFAALLDRGDRFLVDRYALTYSPSAAVWLALGERNAPAAPAGTLALAPRPDALPGSRRETAAIAARVDPHATVLTGAAASEAAFRRLAPGHRILHLATSGVLNKHNPLFSFVDLAPGDGHDGRLEVHEVFTLQLAADLVVLSACETALASGAAADVPPGDDWIGLTRAFLHAGADEVLATLWSVDDRSTARLMEGFHEQLRDGADATLSLARAQRSLLRDPATSDPFHWAGFALIGGGGSAAP